MSCDIHSVAEVFIEGEWRVLLKDVGMKPDVEDRCYATFTALAGVQDTAEWTPIDDPRGWPPGFEEKLEVDPLNPARGRENVRTQTGQLVWMGEHSYSWLLLSEILKFWNVKPKSEKKPPLKRAFVTREAYRDLAVSDVRPQEWFDALPADAVTAHDPRLVNPKADPYRVLLDSEWTHIETSWQPPWGSFAPDREALPLLASMITMLKRLRTKHKVEPEQVRLVFGFDS